MQAQRFLGISLVGVATLVAFSQLYFLVTARPDPMISNFAHHYAIRSSIESFGFAISAAVIGCFVSRGRAGFWLWLAVAVAAVGLWLFVLREVWNHYVVLPRMRSGYLATHSYFRDPFWWLLVRLSWHIMLPVSFLLACVLALKRPSRGTPGGAR